MIIASMMMAVLVCEHVINEETLDGYTHTKGVSCVLYNQLFHVVRDCFILIQEFSVNCLYEKRLYVYTYILIILSILMRADYFYRIGFVYHRLGSLVRTPFTSD